MDPILAAQIALRHELHQQAELSGVEAKTADLVTSFLVQQGPDEIVSGLGGHGLAAVFAGAAAGPRRLFRCELDALPISEATDLAHCSLTSGVSHKCGHDGHMAILAGMAAGLGHRRPDRGVVILLFQPAEETGQGARQVVDDAAFQRLAPDYAFALHNLPGYPAGQILWRKGTFAAASIGYAVTLRGLAAHAAEAEKGRSPAAALAALIGAMSALSRDGDDPDDLARSTVVHGELGERAFGTAPGQAILWTTLRAGSDAALAQLKARALDAAEAIAAAHELQIDHAWVEEFTATINHDSAVDALLAAATALGSDTRELPSPLACSEDFGHYLKSIPGCLFGIGAGDAHSPLHNPDYDFPDEILAGATELLMKIACTG